MTGFHILYEYGKDRSGRFVDQLFLKKFHFAKLLAVQQVKTLTSKQESVELIVKLHFDFY